MKVFIHEAELPFPVRQVWEWHMRPGALERLLPPWEDVRVVSRSGGIDDGGRIHLRVRRGPIRVDIRVRHTDFEPERRFADEQSSGPLGPCVHRHEFEPRGTDACLVRDRVEYGRPERGIRALASSTIEGEMKRYFRFRARRIGHDLARHSAYDGPPLRVAVTGSGGFVGSALSHFLTTGGHEVVPIVRTPPDRACGEVHWDPKGGRIEGGRLDGLDAVVHLAGESISGGRWTAARKREIWRSRVEGTRLLVGALNQLRNPPRTLVSASAIGYYGDRGSERLSEGSGPGVGFLPDLCREWEAEALKARRSGMRVVALRTGLVLSPAGGALETMLLPFRLGVGGRLGSGRQFVSWIDHDDMVALVHHALVTPSLRGPVNATSPYPVANATFATRLGRALRRPTLLPVPSLGVRGIFGEMGRALLLQSARVLPDAALESGFRFEFGCVDESLAHQLGRAAPPDS